MDTPQELTVVTNRDGRVATVTLNRPHTLNAITPPMRTLLMETLARLDEDPAVGCVVLTGRGRGFCSGADTSGLQRLTGARMQADINRQVIAADYPFRMAKPLIAAVNGPVAGIGLCYALMADVRFAAVGAKWVASFAALGLPRRGRYLVAAAAPGRPGRGAGDHAVGRADHQRDRPPDRAGPASAADCGSAARRAAAGCRDRQPVTALAARHQRTGPPGRDQALARIHQRRPPAPAGLPRRPGLRGGDGGPPSRPRPRLPFADASRRRRRPHASLEHPSDSGPSASPGSPASPRPTASPRSLAGPGPAARSGPPGRRGRTTVSIPERIRRVVAVDPGATAIEFVGRSWAWGYLGDAVGQLDAALPEAAARRSACSPGTARPTTRR